jgi:hypothetical protein
MSRFTPVLVAAALGFSVAVCPAMAQQTNTSQTYERSFAAKVLPFAAGATIGAAVGMFIAPAYAASSFALATTAGAVYDPFLGAVGAVIGGYVGTKVMP